MQKALYDRFSGKFYMLCRRYCANDESAKEVMSDGFLCVFEQIGKYKGTGSFEGWMRTIFIRCAIRRYKRDSCRKEVAVEEGMEVVSGNLDQESKLDVRQALMGAMRRLTDSERQTFNLVAVEGYKLEEAAQIMDENLSTLKSRYYKTLQKMREMLTETLGEEYIDQ